MRLLKSPISVVWEVTNYCNFKCPHCRAYMEPVAIDKVIEDGIMDEIIRNNILSVNISGGEPLLNKRILEFISTFSKNKIDVGISSNGWLFKDMARDLIANGLSFLQVSVDGPKEKHDNFRGVGGAFERATEALTIAKGYGIRTQMNVTITSQNIDTLFYNVDLAKELGIDRIFFRRVVPAGKGKLNRYVLPEKKQYLEVIQKLRQLDIPNLNISIDDPVL
jgi:MoaA/NifB/PqqE/SkfB family radical SAM enzyme